MTQKDTERYRPLTLSGLGGVAIGNGFVEHSDIDCLQAMEAAWEEGVRYFDTSPWYGLGLSERRMGLFLQDKKRHEYTLSTKIGPTLIPQVELQLDSIWKCKHNAGYRYEYSADGSCRRIEDSLERMSGWSIDIVCIHDCSPSKGGMKDDWVTYCEEAARGTMP